MNSLKLIFFYSIISYLVGLTVSLILKVLVAYGYLPPEEGFRATDIGRTFFLYFVVGFSAGILLIEALSLIGNLFGLHNYLSYYGIDYEGSVVILIATFGAMFGTNVIMDYRTVLFKKNTKTSTGKIRVNKVITPTTND